jgi:hypothetical protein
LITLGPGLNAEQIGEWLERAVSEVDSLTPYRVVAIQSDASRFDAHQNTSMDFEVKLMRNRVQPKYATQRRALETKSEAVKLYMKGMAAKVVKRRRSGHGDTTSGNSELNANKAIYLLTRDCLVRAVRDPRTVPEDRVLCGQLLRFRLDQVPVRALVAGDDLVLVTDEFLARMFMEYVTVADGELGFKTKASVVNNPFDVEFCSAIFLPAIVNGVHGSYVLTPKPGRVLTRAFCSINEVPDPKRWVGEVACALHMNSAAMPGMRDYYRAIALANGGFLGAPVFERHKFHVNPNDRIELDPSVWDSIVRRYGHDPESWLRMWDRLTIAALERNDVPFEDVIGLFERDVGLPDVNVETVLKQEN